MNNNFMIKKDELKEVLKITLQEELKPISEEVAEIKAYILGNEYHDGIKKKVEKDHKTAEEVRNNLTVIKANRAERYTSELEGIKGKEYITKLQEFDALPTAEDMKYFKKSWKIVMGALGIVNIPSFLQLINFIYQYIPK